MRQVEQLYFLRQSLADNDGTAAMMSPSSCLLKVSIIGAILSRHLNTALLFRYNNNSVNNKNSRYRRQSRPQRYNHPIIIPIATKTTRTTGLLAESALNTEVAPSTRTNMKVYPSFKDAAEHASQHVLESYDGETFVRCGELSCQKDSFQTRLEKFQILSVSPFQEQSSSGGGGQNGKKGKKNKKQSQNGNGVDDEAKAVSTTTTTDTKIQQYHDTKYAVAVSDSILFPEGGGQPPDHGVVKITGTSSSSPTTSGNNDFTFHVTNVQNVNNVCILVCEIPLKNDDENNGMSPSEAEQLLMDSCIIDNTSTTISTMVQEIDWNRRFDLMTQHSAQHLISAIAQNTYQYATNSFSLSQTSYTSFIDFIIPLDDLNNNEQQQYQNKFKSIETIVNDCIRQNLSMTPTWLDPNDPQFQIKVRSRLLPENLQGPIRLVEIGSGNANTNNIVVSDIHDNGHGLIDCNTCCGTHVPSLGVLQMIQFFKMEKVKNGVIRVHYAAAKRLQSIMEENFQRSTQITNILKCPDPEHVSRLQALMDDKRSKETQIQTLYEELCDSKSKEIIHEMNDSGGNGGGGGKHVAVVDLGPNVDRNYMMMLSTMTLERLQQQMQQDENKVGDDTSKQDGKVVISTKETEALLLFVSASQCKVNEKEDDQEGTFLLVGHVDWVNQCGKKIAEILGGRGGGNQGKFQGKASKFNNTNLNEVKVLMSNFVNEK